MGEPRLLSRTILTWFELTVVGLVGGTLGSAAGGPVRYLCYLAVALVSVGVLLYNVDALVATRLDATRADGAGTDGDGGSGDGDGEGSEDGAMGEGTTDVGAADAAGDRSGG